MEKEPQERLHTKAVGDITTAMVIAALSARYRSISIPFGENARYDLVVEEEAGTFLRIQCKTGRLAGSSIIFNTCSVHYPRKEGDERPQFFKRDYRGEADLFGVYCPGNGKVYLVPVDDVGRRSACNLRLDPTLNKQVKGIRWAADYEVPWPG